MDLEPQVGLTPNSVQLAMHMAMQHGAEFRRANFTDRILRAIQYGRYPLERLE